MTIRSATEARTSATAAIIEITMPREEDYFEIGNLIISSHFKQVGQGTVNLTWSVPPSAERKVIGYEVQYAEAGEKEAKWKTIQFRGPKSTAVLDDLKSDTEYLLRITTTLYNNAKTESGQFKFKTPRIDANPIQKVDVIYSHDISSVKLQWVLEPHIHEDKVAGYDVYFTDNKDRPDAQWQFVRVDSAEGSLSLDNLSESTVYYVRVNVRNHDGTVIRAPSIYKFATIDSSKYKESASESNSLSYKNIEIGKVEISWTYPRRILDSVVGATILYTNRKNLSSDQWQRLSIPDSKNTSIVLTNLQPGTRYTVQILPELYTGEFAYADMEQFEMRVDRQEDQQLSRGPPLVRPQERFQQMKATEKEFLRIISCNPDAIISGCAWDEQCIARVDDSKKGWCISNSLKDAVLNS
ncbi:hypothetical protein WR25_03706 [Diploscapter pachys]|uniref:Fibronectin type-III domain-containing protein n=1 Tax=Diploscapter pachys TaxID=2018661 RepID=A0A2A2LP53_9BILA|nr:hypothetical protein WR25_03706 [Diploscapter pachys]